MTSDKDQSGEVVAVETSPDPRPAQSDDTPEPRTRRSRRGLVLAVILVCAFAFYFWTGTTEDANRSPAGQRIDPYNELTSAFLRGHLDLQRRPPASLSSLTDPYDPVQNLSFRRDDRVHDLAFYKGRLYVTWGPTPILTLLLPWRVLHVGDMPVNVAVALFCCAGLLFSVLLLLALAKRFVPKAKTWQLAVATAALALGNVAPFMLRRPEAYELAIASAFCFAMLGAYLLASSVLVERRRLGRIAAASLCIGLAVGGRPDLAFEGLLLIAALVYLVRVERPVPRAEIAKLTVATLAPFLAALALLSAYNIARFGAPFENGASYALTVVNMHTVPMYRAAYWPPNLYYYVVAPVRWTFAFPYFTLPPPPEYSGHVPPYYLNEVTGGLLANAPIVLAVVPAIAVLLRRRRRLFTAVLVLLVTVGTLTLLFLAAALPSTTMRYEVDFASFFLIAGLLGWFVLMSGRWRRAAAVSGVVLVAYGSLFGAAISMYGYFDGLRTAHPDTYWALARLTSPLPTVASMIAGHPVIARRFSVGHASRANGGTYAIDSTPFDLSAEPIEVDIISPRDGDWTISSTITRTPVTEGTPVQIRVSEDDADAPRYVEVDAQPQDIPITLHRGLNRIELSAVPSPGVASAPATSLLTVSGLTLRRP